MESTEEGLIKEYFYMGFEYKEILSILIERHKIWLSLSGLKKRLKILGLTRRNSQLTEEQLKGQISELPLTNYPFSSLLTGILYILVKNCIAIGTLSKMIKVYEAYLQPHRSRNLKEIGPLKIFLPIPTLITDHELLFEYDDYYAMKPSISFCYSVI